MPVSGRKRLFACGTIVTPDTLRGFEDLAGIEINGEQTFGFEFEIAGYRSRQRWEEVARALVYVLREVVPVRNGPGGRKSEVGAWKVVKERSCGLGG